MLIDICCELKGLEEAEKSRGWPQRAGKVVLQPALTRLVRHYGLDVPDEMPAPARHSSWGSKNYLPSATPGAGRRSMNPGSSLDRCRASRGILSTTERTRSSAAS